MTTLVQNIKRLKPLAGGSAPVQAPTVAGRRAMVVAAMVALISILPGGWGLVFDALSEAYLAVSVFVAGTLALVFAAERVFKADLGQWLQRHRRWQVAVATMLGAFPGCGGAIIVVTQFTRGYLGFGAVVATLTATMGDAMFLLLAREPGTALGVLALSMLVAMASGYLVDAMHGADFMRPAVKPVATQDSCAVRAGSQAGRLDAVERLWLGLMMPGFVLGVLAAMQVAVDVQWFGLRPVYWLGVAGAVLALAMWSGDGDGEADCEAEGVCGGERSPLLRSVIGNTNFVTVWVVFAFVAYELLLAMSGIDLQQGLSVWAPLVPAMAILLGLIPGCGPQIMVTSLYLSGSVPLSAQLGNALANDGDALFPALVVAPKAALLATLYSAVPAVLVAYAWYGLVEAV